MNTILFKETRYKKYESVALIKDIENNCFVVALHYKAYEDNIHSYANTPNENMFYYNDSQSELEALKNAIIKFESIKQ